MLLYLLASLPSVSLDPQQGPSGGALAQRPGALLSLVRSASLAWRLPPAARCPSGQCHHIQHHFHHRSYPCIILRICCCINIFVLVVVVDVSGPNLVKNWLDSCEITLFAEEMRYRSSVGRLDRLFKFGAFSQEKTSL